MRTFSLGLKNFLPNSLANGFIDKKHYSCSLEIRANILMHFSNYTHKCNSIYAHNYNNFISKFHLVANQYEPVLKPCRVPTIANGSVVVIFDSQNNQQSHHEIDQKTQLAHGSIIKVMSTE